MKHWLFLFCLFAAAPAFAQQQPDYRLQRDIAMDASAQCYGLWSARAGDLQKQIIDQQAKIAELEKQLKEHETK